MSLYQIAMFVVYAVPNAECDSALFGRYILSSPVSVRKRTSFFSSCATFSVEVPGTDAASSLSVLACIGQVIHVAMLSGVTTKCHARML